MSLLLLNQPRAVAAPVGRLHVSGFHFYDENNRLVIRTSITAFTAPKRFATGRGDDARRYFDWAASMGFNEIRVFASTPEWTGPPGKGVESGWTYDDDATRQTVSEAAARGLRTEVTA